MYGMLGLHLVDFYGKCTVDTNDIWMLLWVIETAIQQEIPLQMIHIPLVHCYLPCTKPRKEESTKHGKTCPCTIPLKAITKSVEQFLQEMNKKVRGTNDPKFIKTLTVM